MKYIQALIMILFLGTNCYAQLPKDLEWLTNNTDPVFASSKAQKGGTFKTALLSFPLTFRTVGPDANSSFRSAILDNQLSLIGLHPDTMKSIPEIATHWAFGKDKKTMYFKLNPQARWSDGKPVTSADFTYTLEFMRSKHIIAPWYNDFYTKELEKVIIYDAYTLAVVSAKAVPDLHFRCGLTPIPRHFFEPLSKDYVRQYNWKITPNTGPYQISKFKKGKSIFFKRKQNWWAKDLQYFKNRFNVDKVKFKVVRDYNMQWQLFKKNKIDCFEITIPKYWHIKTKIEAVAKGYIHKIWFFNDTPRSATGLWLNQDRTIFKESAQRYAFAHAINIQKVIKNVLRNDYFRLEHGFMGYGSYSNPDIKARRFDLQKVSALMQKSGWKRGTGGIWEKDGQRFSVNLSYSRETDTERLVVIKEEAKKAGLELKLQKLDPSAAYKKVMEKKHDVALIGWSTSLRPQYWEHFHSANAHKAQTNNITNTDEPEMDRLIEAFRNSLEADERIALSKKIQTKIHENGAFIPMFMVPYVRHAYWRWLKLPAMSGTKYSTNLFNPFGSFYGGLFWIDEKVQQETHTAMKKGTVFQPITIINDKFKTLKDFYNEK